MLPPLDLAFKYTEESIAKCRQLGDFLRKRQEIEDEYAKSLRKLCKSVSLRPLRKQGWFARATRPHRADEGQDDVQTLLLRRYPPPHTHARPLTHARSNLWSTFYEVVDDTSQIAKAHGILAESLQTQLLAPLDDSIRAMEAARRRVLDEAQAIGAELQEAASVLRKARLQLEDSTNDVNVARLALSRVEGAVAVKPRDLERARARYHVASDRLNLARASFRQCDEVCRALQGKVNQVDVPRLGKLLAALEQARGLDAKQTLQQAMRIDRLTADMDLHCTTSMEHKAAAIVVDDVLDSVLCVASTAPPVSVVPLNGELPAPVDARRYSITRPLPGPSKPPALSTPSSPPIYCPPSIHSSQLLLASVEALGSKRHGPEHTHSMTL